MNNSPVRNVKGDIEAKQSKRWHLIFRPVRSANTNAIFFPGKLEITFSVHAFIIHSFIHSLIHSFIRIS